MRNWTRPEALPATRDLPQVSILLVDDRPENLLALEVSLEPLGQRLVRATSGDAALKAVLDEHFAVILMDIQMPGLDGFETLALLRKRERTRHIPIIFLTAYPEQRTGLKSYASGAVDYIQKPFDPETVRSKVSVFVHLRQHELALQAAHDELEARVAARTAELAAANAALERQATHDTLTGLANRALLLEHLDNALARSRRRTAPSFAVMMLDMDRFKLVNDSLGHLAGDQLLVHVAQRLKRCLRETDTAARIGGDEFAILLDGITEMRDATRLATRIQRDLSQPYDIDGRQVHSSASIGLALMNDRYHSGDELLRDADTALYRAKESGRARCQVFDTEMHAAAEVLLRDETDLGAAIIRDQLVLHYQPIYDIATTRIRGFEALVRWQHPERGLVPPAQFIPLAEDTGLVRPLGRWVLDRACKQLAAWHQTHPDLVMTVNIAPQQLADPELVSQVERALEVHGLAPRHLVLELTERALVGRTGMETGALQALRDLGVQISLDDFGTGYSCLGRLHELSAAALKIDRSFVQELGSEREGARPAIARALLTLAKGLGLRVVAEGVETEAQLARLRELGCDFAQGHLFSPAVDADAAAALLP